MSRCFIYFILFVVLTAFCLADESYPAASSLLAEDYNNEGETDFGDADVEQRGLLDWLKIIGKGIKLVTGVVGLLKKKKRSKLTRPAKKAIKSYAVASSMSFLKQCQCGRKTGKKGKKGKKGSPGTDWTDSAEHMEEIEEYTDYATDEAPEFDDIPFYPEDTWWGFTEDDQLQYSNFESDVIRSEAEARAWFEKYRAFVGRVTWGLLKKYKGNCGCRKSTYALYSETEVEDSDFGVFEIEDLQEETEFGGTERKRSSMKQQIKKFVGSVVRTLLRTKSPNRCKCQKGRTVSEAAPSFYEMYTSMMSTRHQYQGYEL